MQPSMQPNPYAPPNATLGFAPDEGLRFEFDAEVLESDVHVATRRLGRFLLGSIFFGSMFLLSIGVILINPTTANLPLLIYLAPLCVLFLLLSIRTTWLNLGPGAGRLRVRATPTMIGHIYGTITESEIQITNETSTSVHPLKACCFAKVQANTLSFAFDQRRLVLHVLPRHAFPTGCFERAAKLLIQHAAANRASQAAKATNEQLLQTDQFFQIDMPKDGVAFSGPLMTRDILVSPLRNQNKKVKRTLILTGIGTNLFLLSFIYTMRKQLPLEAGLILFAVFLWGNFRLWKAYRVSVNWTKTPDQVMMQLRGVINDQAFYATTPTGACIYRWGVFTEATFQDDLISLALPGKLGHRVLLARRQFASDNEWSQAKELIRTKADLFPTIEK